MKQFKERWEITQNWQFIHFILGFIATFFSAYLIAKPIIKAVNISNSLYHLIALILATVLISYLIIKLTLWIFKWLEKKWDVKYRWQLVAIFLAFAVTGSSAGKLSDPFMELIGLPKETINGWFYWPVRIVLIFPIYQVLLLIFGWLFGQFNFFWNFEKKMLRRMGFAKLLKE